MVGFMKKRITRKRIGRSGGLHRADRLLKQPSHDAL